MGSRLIFLRSPRETGRRFNVMQADWIASGRLRSRYSQRDDRENCAGNRTKTDTGRRDEYSKALERTLVKELCKLAP